MTIKNYIINIINITPFKLNICYNIKIYMIRWRPRAH
eukprot:SAG22_NODE_1_length_62449_cov_158.689270_8_plen_37_part_00